MAKDAEVGGAPGDPGDLFEALEQSAGQAEWTPLFADDFNRTSLGDDWRIIGGEADIKNGWMRVRGRSGDVYAVVLRAFPENVRVEFDARFPKGQDIVSDLACFVAGDEHKTDAAGYCLSFGADENCCSRLQRQAIDIRINLDMTAEAGRTYSLASQLLDGELSLSVDGQVVLRYVDMLPLAGVGHDHLGLATFKLGAEFSNFRVLTRTGPVRSGAFTIPDAYCRDGLYDRAIEKYRQVAETHPNEPLSLMARCKTGLALFADRRWSDAEGQFRSLSSAAKGSKLEHLVALWHARALGMMGKLDEAFRIFSRVQDAGDPGMVDEAAVACGLLCHQLRVDSRWLESGRCAKFLFENSKTPLIQTMHAFNRYGRRLGEAAFHEEEYQAVSKLGMAITARRTAAIHTININLSKAALGILTGRIDEARGIYDDLEKRFSGEEHPLLQKRLMARRIQIDMARGKYQRAFDQLDPLPEAKDEKQKLVDSRWGVRLPDLRIAALILLDRTDEAIDESLAGQLSGGALDQRIVLGAELRKRGRGEEAEACLAILKEQFQTRWGTKFVSLSVDAVLGKGSPEALREYVDNELMPSFQPLGLFFTGLALWAGDQEEAATIPWSEAENSALDVTPAWHWTRCFQQRVGK